MSAVTNNQSYQDYNDPTLSFILFKFNRDLKFIVGDQERLVKMADLFNNTADIRPIDCDHAVKMIGNFIKSIIQIEDAIKEISDLSLSLLPIRYRLLKDIYRADQFVTNLTTLLIEFRSICFLKTRQRAETLREIQINFLSLVEASQMIKVAGESLLDLSLSSSEYTGPYLA
jgi:hypothetical protein